MVKQLSVFVENQKGRLAAVVDLLSSFGINMYALSVADTSDFGILRLIVDDNEKALQILQEKNVIASLTDVTVVKMPNTPGGLSEVLWTLAGANINIEYVYAFVAGSGDGAYVVLRVEDNDVAAKVLTEHNFPIMNQSDLT